MNHCTKYKLLKEYWMVGNKFICTLMNYGPPLLVLVPNSHKSDHLVISHEFVWCIIVANVSFAEDQDHTPKKGQTNRTRNTTTSKRKRPATKRRRKNSESTVVAHNSSPSRQTNLPITSMSGTNISASSSSSSSRSSSSRSSSSEDEFDRLVKDWEDDSIAKKQVKEGSACRGRRRTRK